jgi:hypothetical protein
MAKIGLNLYKTFDTDEFANALDLLIKTSNEEIKS